MPRGHASAQAPPHRIDVHHHFAPPQWVAAVGSRDLLQPRTRDWTRAKSIDDMDRGGVETAVVSITNPGLWFGDNDETRRLARECNEHGARLVQDTPRRFGMFAALPLPQTEASLREIAYALDVLKADGIGLFTSYGDRWLGDPAFTPVFEDLNRRKAVVYTHPTAASCCRNLVPDVPPSVIEYATDTTRAMAGLLFSGTAARFPDIRFIFSHGGGTMPFLTGRFLRQEAAMKDRQQRLPRGLMHELRKFHYDIAQAAHPTALGPLLQIVPASQLLFGTDSPIRSSEEQAKALAAYGLSAGDLRAIERENARRLLPQLRKG